jgi:hypothetical protein
MGFIQWPQSSGGPSTLIAQSQLHYLPTQTLNHWLAIFLLRLRISEPGDSDSKSGWSLQVNNGKNNKIILFTIYAFVIDVGYCDYYCLCILFYINDIVFIVDLKIR